MMQQTETYKLNLIESSDPFLPDGLNANTQKIEDVLAAREALSDSKLAEMDERVTVLEGHKAVIGTYTGKTQSAHFVNLGFTPIAVIISSPRLDFSCLGVLGGPTHPAKVVENGFEVHAYGSNNFDEGGQTYAFLAIV